MNPVRHVLENIARTIAPDLAFRADRAEEFLEMAGQWHARYEVAAKANRAAVETLLHRDISLVHRLDQTTALITELGADPDVPEEHRVRCALHLAVITHGDRP